MGDKLNSSNFRVFLYVFANYIFKNTNHKKNINYFIFLKKAVEMRGFLN